MLFYFVQRISSSYFSNEWFLLYYSIHFLAVHLYATLKRGNLWLKYPSGPGCSKLTMPVVNKICKTTAILCYKKVRSFAVQKLLSLFAAKNISKLDFICSRRLSRSLANDVVKLTLL